jgi:DNA polymerase-3 subunit gamma/tau
MSGASITEHLQHILAQENIPCESVALQLIARAAAGSMRDALSLLDQAIAYGSNAVHETEVRAMLGAVDQSYLFVLLHALINNDGVALMAQAREMEQRSLSFDTALNDLAQLLHQVAIVQTVPESIATDLPERDALLDLAQKTSAENIQLYYQIALLGRRDLGLAPDEFAGFTMCLLRMLAFTPGDKITPLTQSQAPSKVSKPAVIALATSAPPATDAAVAETAQIPSPAATPSPTGFDGNWRDLVDQLKLGLARALAQNCELLRFDEQAIYLSVPQNQKHLLNQSYQEKLSTAISQYFGKKLQLHFEIGGTGNTPAQQISEEKATLQSNAVAAINEDDFVQALVKDFDAQIIPASIKPIQK